MGCVGCTDKLLPARPEPVKHQDADSPGIDDLGWIPVGGGPSMPSEAARAKRRFEGVKVQIELPGGWTDCSPEETRQICELKARGEAKFSLQARGQLYTIDMEDRDGPTQMNANTGKKRKLRIIDLSDESPLDAAEADASGETRGQKASLQAETISPEVARQRELGPQSKRGNASQHPYRVLADDKHAQECFAQFERNEQRLCGEWCVFYHSYSFAALIYELQAAVGSVLFRFRSQYGVLPRILVNEFDEIADAGELLRRFNTEFASYKRDHHPSFRRVALSAMCSLASTGPEACTAMVFIAGYSCKDLNFRSVIENLLESCYVPKSKVKKLADDILSLSEKHGLDVSQYGGKACKSGKAGHLLQICIKRNLVDKLVYAAKPYGFPDEERMPISQWMNSDKSFSLGQARIVCHPKYFMQANNVRLNVASADPTFHRNRQAFQEELISLLAPILGARALREKAATGIYGGKLPAWWNSADQRELAGLLPAASRASATTRCGGA